MPLYVIDTPFLYEGAREHQVDYVAKQLEGLIPVAEPAIPVLLRMAVKPAKDDPRKVLQHDIARALFYNGKAQPIKGLLPMFGLEGVDRSLLIPAIKEILTNKNGIHATSTGIKNRTWISWVCCTGRTFDCRTSIHRAVTPPV